MRAMFFFLLLNEPDEYSTVPVWWLLKRKLAKSYMFFVYHFYPNLDTLHKIKYGCG
jgi:hypothetical protein